MSSDTERLAVMIASNQKLIAKQSDTIGTLTTAISELTEVTRSLGHRLVELEMVQR